MAHLKSNILRLIVFTITLRAIYLPKVRTSRILPSLNRDLVAQSRISSQLCTLASLGSRRVSMATARATTSPLRLAMTTCESNLALTIETWSQLRSPTTALMNKEALQAGTFHQARSYLSAKGVLLTLSRSGALRNSMEPNTQALKSHEPSRSWTSNIGRWTRITLSYL